MTALEWSDEWRTQEIAAEVAWLTGTGMSACATGAGLTLRKLRIKARRYKERVVE